MSAVCLASAVVVDTQLRAAPQEPSTTSAVSLDRIRRQLEKPPTVKLNVPLPGPAATFRSRVERAYVPPFDEWLRKQFELTALQRQSAEWGAKCCGINLGDVFKSVKSSRQERQSLQLRKEIMRELAELEAARKKAAEKGKLQ